MDINQTATEVGIKKRTLIFWVKEFGLEPFILQSNAGNTYSAKAVRLLKAVKILKDPEWFSASFIRLVIDSLKENTDPASLTSPLSQLPQLADLESSLAAVMSDSTPPSADESSPDSLEEEIRKLEEKVEAFPESPNLEDWLFTLAEIYRSKTGSLAKAAICYGRLRDMESSYSQVASIYLDILNNMDIQE